MSATKFTIPALQETSAIVSVNRKVLSSLSSCSSTDPLASVNKALGLKYENRQLEKGQFRQMLGILIPFQDRSPSQASTTSQPSIPPCLSWKAKMQCRRYFRMQGSARNHIEEINKKYSDS